MRPREIRTRLATCLLLQDRPEEAEAVLKEEQAIRPHITVDALLVLAYLGESQPRKALEIAEQCVALDSTRVSHELLAWTLVAGDLDLDRGVREAQVAQKLPLAADDHYHRLPCFPPAEHSLGLAALKQGDTQKAVDLLQSAASKRPTREAIQSDLRRATSQLQGTP